MRWRLVAGTWNMLLVFFSRVSVKGFGEHQVEDGKLGKVDKHMI